MIPLVRFFYDVFLIIFQRTYFGGRMATCHDATFLGDPAFLDALKSAESRNTSTSATYAWNMNIACWCATQAYQLKGDFVECGTAKGSTAACILNWLSWKTDSRVFYLFDTFQGMLSQQLTQDDHGADRQYYNDTYEDVKTFFSKWPTVIPVKGIVPDSLSSIPTETKVAFLHIDMNCATPEAEALEFFRSRLLPGAIILLDDYGWLAYGAQKIVHDKFAASLGVKVLQIPTGQGIIVVPQK